ncbi:hypothetical protein V7S43_007617 [Phytophthora oleae]|uniref:RxLR effector protein n=1 Tax=Phytophthora oleae TaxID=2107226 RepID=A0ABD3FNR7_9STRA
MSRERRLLKWCVPALLSAACMLVLNFADVARAAVCSIALSLQLADMLCPMSSSTVFFYCYAC